MLFPKAMAIEATAKRDALDGVLKSESFARSESLRAFLRYVCEAEIEGRAQELTEYVIGVDALGRPPGYSPAQDGAVRNKAYELRHKLARYYEVENPKAPIKIEIPKGGYAPRFVLHEVATGRRRTWLNWYILAASAAVLVLLASWSFWHLKQGDPVERLWSPLLVEGKQVTVCFGAVRVRDVIGPVTTEIDRGEINKRGRQLISIDAASFGPIEVAIRRDELTGVGAAMGLFNVGAQLERLGQGKQLRLVDGTRYGDLAQHPTVLIGLDNNPLSLATLQDLPITPEGAYLKDARHPEKRWGPVRGDTRDYKEDYGIAARLLKTPSRQPLIILAGIFHCGTGAATELFTDRGLVEAVIAGLPADWERRNIQIVVRTKVVEGACGAPEIVASRTW